MNVLVLGLGLQGKAVVHDLERSDLVRQIVVADLDLAAVEQYLASRGCRKARAAAVDARRPGELERLVQDSGAPVVVCMLPPEFGHDIARAAIAGGVHFVSSSYTGRLAELDGAARAQGVAVLPEMGMDPGIDLLLARIALDELDQVHGLYSYGGGVPEPACADDNPLHYKITWTFDGLLKAYKRPARFLKKGQEIVVPGEEIFLARHGHMVEVPGPVALEAYPNGDAIRYIDIYGLQDHIQDMGRFALRYPGHNQFWAVMAQLGFLEDVPLKIDDGEISPRQFLVRHLAPRLQFKAEERDMVVLKVDAWGLKAGKARRVTYTLIDYRDLDTGLFAMNRTVGFTTSIGAQMLLSAKIRQTGLLSPARDVPAREVLEALKARGMKVDHHIQEREAI